MPVFPLVGSMICVSFVRMPSRSAASIIARPIRSFTLQSGLKNSSFTSTVAAPAGTTRFSLTSGVLNVVSTILLNVFRSDMGYLLPKCVWRVDQASPLVPGLSRHSANHHNYK